MFGIAMFDLSTPGLIWLPIAIAILISFVKNSIQASVSFFVLTLLLSAQFQSYHVWVLLPGCLTLLLSSLVIPKPNPRHQKRRFHASKFIYLLLTFYTAWILHPHFTAHASLKKSFQEISPDLLQLIGLVSFFILATLLIMTRKHVT
jgi:hypothetical protein